MFNFEILKTINTNKQDNEIDTNQLKTQYPIYDRFQRMSIMFKDIC